MKVQFTQVLYLNAILRYFLVLYTFTPLHLFDSFKYFADSDYYYHYY